MQITTVNLALLINMAVAKNLHAFGVGVESHEAIFRAPVKHAVKHTNSHRKGHLGSNNKRRSVEKRSPQQQATVTATPSSTESIVTVTVTTCKPRSSQTAPAQADQAPSVPPQANTAAKSNAALAILVVPAIFALL
ncbi:hypothetical protein CJU90_3684 [Yarrowia sp. C11]|nr:hypothetical protein CKK34_5294 [Yarrowia sp. E02]KAG5367390.1 hypothetical protein CJU90_3684 [Yarrowia sp. C11]